jgi:hypothetical protein
MGIVEAPIESSPAALRLMTPLRMSHSRGRFAYRSVSIKGVSRQTAWSIPPLPNALHCHQYQACEHPCSDSSQAHAFCDALLLQVIARSPATSDPQRHRSASESGAHPPLPCSSSNTSLDDFPWCAGLLEYNTSKG